MRPPPQPLSSATRLKDGGEIRPPAARTPDRRARWSSSRRSRTRSRCSTEAAARAKGTKLAAETLMALAAIQNQLGLFVDAVKSLEAVVKDHPKSPYVAGRARSRSSRSRSRGSRCRRRTRSFPARRSRSTRRSRNVKELAVTVVVDPARRALPLGRAGSTTPRHVVRRPEADVGGARDGAACRDRQAAKFAHATGDDGRHRPLAQKIPVPALSRTAPTCSRRGRASSSGAASCSSRT